jgi:GH18 family chitinase
MHPFHSRIFAVFFLTALLTGPMARAATLCKRVVAYYTSWTAGNYSASMVPYGNLTHINFAFVTPNTDGTLNGVFGSPYTSGILSTDCANLVTGAHGAGAKVLISIGGAGVPSATFSALAANAAAVSTFVNNVYGMAVSNGFDGVDVDWEYPQSASDRTHFSGLIQALRAKFNASAPPAPTWQISAALSPDGYYAQFLDLPTLAASMDFFNLMIYDYHGSWTSHSGHNAALYQAAGDLAFGHTGDDGADAVSYYTSHGAPASQINYGLAFYGYGFNTGDIFRSCPSGACTTSTMAYNQISPLVGTTWARYWDNSAMSPYLLPMNGSVSMISYDDAPSILAKSNYALNNAQVGGVFMWALNQDYLGPGNQPLLTSMVQMASLCGSPTPTPFPTYTPVPTATPVISSTWRINAGGSDHTDGLGSLWKADNQFLGGSSASTGSTVTGTGDPPLFQSERWGAFSYVLNVPPGSYQVTLRFAEIYWTLAGKRVFNVSINGTPFLNNFDIVADAGGAFKADDKIFSNVAPNGSGQIVIQFSVGAADQPKVSALQIIPMPPTPTPTATPSATFTPSFTDTPCMVAGTPCTPTLTPTPTDTPNPGAKPLLYPNPLKGEGPIQMRVDLPKSGEVKVRVYSVSYRMVREFRFPNAILGTQDLILDLHDQTGKVLSDGLYYFRVETPGGHWDLKFLFLH